MDRPENELLAWCFPLRDQAGASRLSVTDGCQRLRGDGWSIAQCLTGHWSKLLTSLNHLSPSSAQVPRPIRADG